MASWIEQKRTKRSAGRKPALRRVLAALFAAMLAGGIYVVTVALAGPTVPAPTITAAPADPTNQTSATFEFSDSQAGVTFQCSLDGAPWAACTSPTTYAGPLKAGGHTFKVKAKNAQNQTSSDTSYGWTIDLTPPPAPQITSKPANPSNQSSPSFGFKDSEANTTFLCKLDDAASFTACTSPQSYSGLTAGSHTFRVEAKDAAGNISSATSYTWTIDLTPPPTPSITSTPPSLVSSHDASFGFSDAESGVSFLCSLDGDSFKPCNTPKKYTGVDDGLHVFSVEAVDAAGNASSPASYTWTIDTHAPPKPTITSAPSDPSFETTASFEFTVYEVGATYFCKLDGTPWAACSSPKTYTGLALGDHDFKVRGVDAAGNQGAEVAYHWKIKKLQGAPFTISGSASDVLYPGGASSPIDLVFQNPNTSPITVTSATVTVTGTSAASCGAANFTMAQQLQASPVVPAGSTRSLTQLGVPQSQWPKLRMLGDGNQDACKNATVHLSYAGTATG
jgi:large repetitive protein